MIKHLQDSWILGAKYLLCTIETKWCLLRTLDGKDGVQQWHLGDSETSLASKRGFNEQVLEASPSRSFSLRLLAIGRNPINLRDVPSMEFLPSVPDSTFNPCSSLKKRAHTHWGTCLPIFAARWQGPWFSDTYWLLGYLWVQLIGKIAMTDSVTDIASSACRGCMVTLRSIASLSVIRKQTSCAFRSNHRVYLSLTWHLAQPTHDKNTDDALNHAHKEATRFVVSPATAALTCCQDARVAKVSISLAKLT